VFLDRKEMVITARGLYACRFRIGIGSPEIINEGVYQIESKFPEPRYIGETGEISFGDPRNPLGTHWIGLDQEIGIHGTNTPSCLGTDNAPVEGFSLDNRDVAEVYDMLTQESRVTVRK
ncbi:MAG: L,D-transpeptidase, partial [Planctomycetaceae bacterium]|nr:L,D-transpeptidase [Planctomycetaceae bacterium]